MQRRTSSPLWDQRLWPIFSHQLVRRDKQTTPFLLHWLKPQVCSSGKGNFGSLAAICTKSDDDLKMGGTLLHIISFPFFFHRFFPPIVFLFPLSRLAIEVNPPLVLHNITTHQQYTGQKEKQPTLVSFLTFSCSLVFSLFSLSFFDQITKENDQKQWSA